MVIGDKSYQLNLSRIAVSYQGAISMDYLDNAPCSRIKQLSEHITIISKELKNNGG
jgi:hypothetical protein